MAVDGLQDFSTQTRGAAAEVKSLGAAGTEAAAAFSPLDAATKTLQASLDKLSASQGPRGLIRAAAEAKVALAAYETAARSAGVTTENMGAKVAGASAQISAAADRVGIFRKAQTDLGAQAALTGSQLDALRGRAGSLTSMFSSMEQTGTGLTKTVGQVGLGFGIAGIAFAGAEAAGKALGAALLEIEAAYSALEEKRKQAADTEDRERNALAAAAAGHIKYGNSLAGTVANYQAYIAASGKAGIATEAFVDALKKIEPPKNITEATANLTTFAIALEAAYKKSTSEGAAFMAANRATFDKIAEGFRTLGELAPVEFEKIVTAQRQAVAAQKLLGEAGARDAIEAFSKITAARKAADDAASASAGRAFTNAEAARKALNAETVDAETYSKRKAAIYAVETAAMEAAAAAQTAADAKAALEQAKLKRDMDLSASAFASVAKAAGVYAADVAAGVQPSAALADKVDALRKAIAATGEAVPHFDADLDKLAKGGMKSAADQAEAASKQMLEFQTQTAKATEKVTLLGAALEALKKQFPGVLTFLDDMAKKMASVAGATEQAALVAGGTAGED